MKNMTLLEHGELATNMVVHVTSRNNKPVDSQAAARQGCAEKAQMKGKVSIPVAMHSWSQRSALSASALYPALPTSVGLPLRRIQQHYHSQHHPAKNCASLLHVLCFAAALMTFNELCILKSSDSLPKASSSHSVAPH
jgi:hypothetical protein